MDEEIEPAMVLRRLGEPAYLGAVGEIRLEDVRPSTEPCHVRGDRARALRVGSVMDERVAPGPGERADDGRAHPRATPSDERDAAVQIEESHGESIPSSGVAS